MKFYCMPSATHCSGIRMDYLEWLDTWCSEEKYPEETLYGVIEKTGGEMPMATFPGWVKYKDGDPLKGTSYEVSYEIPEGFFDNFAQEGKYMVDLKEFEQKAADLRVLGMKISIGQDTVYEKYWDEDCR